MRSRHSAGSIVECRTQRNVPYCKKFQCRTKKGAPFCTSVWILERSQARIGLTTKNGKRLNVNIEI